MQIKEIHTREEIIESYNVLTQIYEKLDPATFVEDILNMMQRGYKMAAVFDDDNVEKKGHCVGVIGVRIIRKLNYGKSLEIEDFMIDRKKRGIGVGKMLIRWAEWQSAIFDCKHIIHQKDELIFEFMEQLKQKDDEYIKALKKQNDDIDDLIKAMSKQFLDMRTDYHEQLEQIEKQF